jgi:hypothetical protein
MGTVHAGILTAGDQVLVMQSRCSVGATSASVGELPRQAAPPKGSTRRSSTVFASKKSGPAAAPTTTAQSTRQFGRHVQVDLTVESVPCVVARARSSRTEVGRSLRPTASVDGQQARLCFRAPPRRVGCRRVASDDADAEDDEAKDSGTVEEAADATESPFPPSISPCCLRCWFES